MKWKPKNETCGVPGRGYIKADDYNDQDEKNLQERAIARGIDFNVFMLNAGFVPVSPQLEIQVEEKPKRTRKPKENGDSDSTI